MPCNGFTRGGALAALALTLVAAPLAACDLATRTDEVPATLSEAVTGAGASASAQPLEITREHVVGDVYHYGFLLRVGVGANAQLHVHRVVREHAPWLPRASVGGVMLLHGDFSTFASNFAPSLGSPASASTGMAVYLAQKDLDVWGFDRRWTQAPAGAEADLSDFAAMGVVAALDDLGRALRFARVLRFATGAGANRLALLGFSRGGQLAYAYVAREAQRPLAQRHVKALVPLDVFYTVDPADEAMRQNLCARRDLEVADLDHGVVDAPNDFFVTAGLLALTAPDEPSPLFDGYSNRDTLLALAGQTYFFFQPTPAYHLAAPELEGDVVTALRESPEAAIATWFAAAAPHQALREAAEGDALWCGAAPLPIEVHLEQIRVPLFYVGAAGGFGDHGLYTTTLLGSTDKQALVVRRFGAEREIDDFGHGNLLFACDAPELAWKPLATWLKSH